MKRNFTKRFISYALIFAMMLGLLPFLSMTGVFADDSAVSLTSLTPVSSLHTIHGYWNNSGTSPAGGSVTYPNSVSDNYSNIYYNSIVFRMTSTFMSSTIQIVNRYDVGKFSSLKGTIALSGETRNTNALARFRVVEIRSDNTTHTLYTSPVIMTGIRPIDFEVDLTNVLDIEVRVEACDIEGISGNRYNVSDNISIILGNPRLGIGENTEPLPSVDSFSAEKNGWFINNWYESFGYPYHWDNRRREYVSDYRIPLERYADTFQIRVLSSMLSWLRVLPKWGGGSCFGMSLAAVANYNEQINLKPYFPRSIYNNLYDHGANNLELFQGKEIFTIKGNNTLIKLIERYQLSQKSVEFEKSEVFKDDKTYSELLKYLKDKKNTVPIIITTSGWNGFNHAIVTDMSRSHEIEELEAHPNWFYIPLYDPNAPRNSNLLTNPHDWYLQSDSYLLINIVSGEWEYYANNYRASRNDYVAYRDKNGLLIIPSVSIKFYNISTLSKSFFAPSTSLKMLEYDSFRIDFWASDIAITNNNGERLFEVENNDIIYISENCEYTPYYETTDSENYLRGNITIRNNDTIQYKTPNAEMIVWSENFIYTMNSSGLCETQLDIVNGTLTLNAKQSSNVNIGVQNRPFEAECAGIIVSGNISKDEDLLISLKDSSNVEIKSSDKNLLLEITTETTNNSPETIKDVQASEISRIDINNSIVILNETITQLIQPEQPSSWATNDVNRAIHLNLVSQSLQSRYSQTITRAEFASLAVRLYETIRGEITGRVTFADTNDVNVQKAAYIGIVMGVGNNRFDPNALLSREQAATMLSRFASAVGTPLNRVSATFADNSQIASWAIVEVGQIQAVDIMRGVGNNRFAPQDPYTREQSIITILRMFDFVNNQRTVSPTTTASPEPANRATITIKGVEYSTALTRLYLRRQSLTNADIEPLKYMTNLTSLHLLYNNISNISALSGLTKLEYLDLYGNQISDISVLRGLTNLTWLKLSFNAISDISVLRELTNLTWLDLHSNNISDISALRSLTNLKELDLRWTKISEDDKKALQTALPNCDITF